MKQQRISRNQPKKQAVVIDERSHMPAEPQALQIDPAIANLPLRTVTYVEVGSMEPAKVQLLMQEINAVHANAKGGIHYVIPIRNGKIGTDIVFEQQFLDVVKDVCEVNGAGEIVLKNGATDCNIIRNKV